MVGKTVQEWESSQQPRDEEARGDMLTKLTWKGVKRAAY